MKFFRIAAYICVFLTTESFGQDPFLPQNLGENVNSEYSEINPILSPDGKTLYFNRVNHPENFYGIYDSQDIWMSTLQDDNTWSTAVRLPNTINRVRHNAILSIAQDGQSVLVNGRYTKKNKWRKRGLSISHLSGDEWGTPVKLKVPKLSRKNKGQSSNAYLSPDSKILLLSYTKRFNGKKNNLYVSTLKKNGNFKAPSKIRRPANSGSREEAPFISNDGKKLYFASNRKKGIGNLDIYVCERTDDSYKRWSKPVLLSDTINSTHYESYFKTNLSGSWAIFCSDKNSLGKSDIFKVKMFEENPFVVVTGKIINKTKGTPLTGKANYQIFVDGIAVDSIEVNQETAAYSFRLPLGKSYQLQAALPYYNAYPESVDVSNIKVYTEKEVNLLVEPIPYVLLKGKVAFADDIETVSFDKIKLSVNGQISDSTVVNSDGTYEIRLPFGKKYQLNAVADQHTSTPAIADLLGIEEYQEITLNLPIQKVEEKMAYIIGKVLDNKTLVALAPTVNFSIQVNGEPYPAEIVKDSAFYKIRVELGKKYVINAQADYYFPVFEEVDLSAQKQRLTLNRTLVVTPIEVGQKVRLNNIFFQSGKAVLMKSSFDELDKVVKFLNDNPDINIEVGGHTDNVGNAASNLKLSSGRATAVESYLESKGINKDRVISKGYGMTQPVADNATPEGKAENRRVEFTILGK
jgi:outer membrane protein OmpA-like peptidoglycan-associated protein